MTRILVPTDFSENAVKAAAYAASIAMRNGASVFLLHVTLPVEGSIRQPFRLQERYQHAVEEAENEQLEKFRVDVATAFPKVNFFTHLAHGTVLHCINDFVLSHDINLVVMGTRGATGLKEVFVGSETAAFIGETRVPVLAVPVNYRMEVPDALMYVTNNFEEHTGYLQVVTGLATLFGAVVHVAVFLENEAAETADYLVNARQLNFFLEFLQKHFPQTKFVTALLQGDDMEHAIEQYEDQHAVDIIAVVTHQRNFWQRLFKKSVTRKLTYHSRIPVLAIPATAN